MWMLVVIVIPIIAYAAELARERLARLPTAVCEERTQTFVKERELEALKFGRDLMPPLSGAAPDTPPLSMSHGAVITLEPSAVLIDGNEFEPALVEMLLRGRRESMAQTAAALHNPLPLRLNVLATRDVTWDSVVALMHSARDMGFDRADFFFERPASGPRVSVWDELVVSMMRPKKHDRWDQDEDPWNEFVRRLAPECSGPGLLAYLLQPTDPEILVSPPLLQCGCAVDPDLVRLLFHAPGTPWTHLYVGGSTRLSGEASRDITFPASARWDDVAAPFMKAVRESEAPVRPVSTPTP